MSRHWRPGNRGDWTVIENYRFAERRARGGAVLLVLGAVFLGLLAGAGWQRWSAPVADTGPSGPIEWNAVQAVPTRAPDASDVAWQRRAGKSPVIASGSNAIQDIPVSVSGGFSDQSNETAATGLPRAFGARNDDAGWQVSGQRIRVIDGDTFDINGERIRVAGIDAPEIHPARCSDEFRRGLLATQKLAELLRGRPLWVSGIKVDRYGRNVAVVRVNGEDVADAMIGSGLARSYDGKQRQGWC